MQPLKDGPPGQAEQLVSRTASVPRKTRFGLKVKLGLVLFSIAAALVGAESAYRLKLKLGFERGLSYRIAPVVYVEFDERFGERFKPNTTLWLSYVQNGQVVWGTVASRSNRDGLGGKTTIEEYRRADVKILVFGDSCTHWNQEGVTWPDLLEQKLKDWLGKNVAVLNYARGSYGVLQMLDLASDRAPELRPDLIVIAPIHDDFTRARWWCKEVRDEGWTRWMLSSRPDAFLDYRFAVDQLIVHPSAMQEWCETVVANGGRDPLVDEINTRVRKLKGEGQAVRNNLFSLSESYLLRRITTGSPCENLSMVPRTAIEDYSDDARARTNITRLKALGIPIVLVYLPLKSEVKNPKDTLSDIRPQTKHLMASLEREMGSAFRLLHQEHRHGIPSKMDLMPYDGHPNRAALEWYADGIAPICLEFLDRPAIAEP